MIVSAEPEGAGTNDEVERLALRLQFLTSVSRGLASSFDAPERFERIANAAVPAIFAGIEIDARGLDVIEPFTVRAGRLAGPLQTYPLVADGKSFGTLRVACANGAEFDRIDLAVSEDVAARMAIALWTADVFAREHRLANALQRALLPELLPQTDRFRHSAAYLPATDEAIVGGDWYDVFDLPDGRIAFSIGDVAGHGLRAAIVMGEVRQAFRAAAASPETPSLVLERANRVVNLRPDGLMVTALFGVLDRRSGNLTYAVAGHPAPVLAAQSGAVVSLPSGGLPLGVADSVQTRDWTFTLAPGALLVLYTDGLIENSRDVVEGEQRLAEVLALPGLASRPDCAQAIVDAVFADRGNADDVAVLAIAVADAAEESFAFDFSAVPLGVPLMRRELARFAENQGLHSDGCFALLTAAGEAAANAVEHAYGDATGIVRVRSYREDDSLVVAVRDEGRWKSGDLDLRDERGRGLRIMRALMDRVEIRRSQADTTVRLSIGLSA
jgi:serine phosphatase RsbU (regulator of sigma subunit)/anti-sigma regulatory factor (Ser/Thr protein kinase)